MFTKNLKFPSVLPERGSKNRQKADDLADFCPKTIQRFFGFWVIRLEQTAETASEQLFTLHCYHRYKKCRSKADMEGGGPRKAAGFVGKRRSKGAGGWRFFYRR